MSINLDLSKIQAYSTALSSKLCNNFFSGKEVISGEQILSFTSVSQLNLFVIKTLFDRWKEELQKLRSPYFNYESTDVQEALNSLMNTLSKNIAVTKEFYAPLVQKAIYETIILCISPSEYLQQEFNNKASVSKAALVDKLKYHKLYESFFKSLKDQLNNFSDAEISGAELRKLIPSLATPNMEEEYKAKETLEELATLLSFDVKDFNPQSSPRPFLENDVAATINAPFGTEAKTIVSSESVTLKKPAEKNVLYPKAGEQQLTINDALKTSHETRIADRFSKSKIEDIKSSIPLNLKFLFINILFDGNSVDYATALSQIEQSESFEKVREFLSKEYGEKYGWKNHTEEADEFLKIIERKFY